ncbi:MAG: hypothetical protein JXL80_02580, partial [Planctomycetes bacterium]|nr:hypothetical protein [Planctomycetota bacterium]
MSRIVAVPVVVALLLMTCPAMAQNQAAEPAPPNAVRDALATESAAEQDAAAHEHKKGAPLPFHSIEGVSGGAITPMAYLCNAGPDCGCNKCSRPTAAYSFVNLGSKEMHVVSVTQVFFGRIELGYAANFLSLGSLVDDVRGAGLDMGRDSVQLHHFNLRA